MAQFMYLDADGDGNYNPPDSWAFLSFDTTTVDVYLVTDRNRLGSPTICSDAAPGLRGYTVNLYSIDAPFTVLSVSNQMPGMSETVPLVAYPYALSVGYSGGRTFPPGKYLLLRIRLARLPTILSAGCGTLGFVTQNCYSPPGVETGFESDCSGVAGDGFLRYGQDWSDVGDLVGCTDNTGRAPTLACPSEITVREGETLSYRVTATDPDCAVPSFGFNSLPPGATVSGPSSFVNGESFYTVTLKPATGQAGSYSSTFYVADPDPFNFRDRYSECTTQITVLPAEVTHEARLFTTVGNSVTRLPHGKPFTCLQIEPVAASFALEDVVPSSILIHYSSAVCGTRDIAASTAKTITLQDTDGNGVGELEACFDQEGLSTLTPCLETGTTVLPLEIVGALANGDLIHGTISQTFVRKGHALAAVSPNPVSPASIVEFITSASGFARVELFDVQGKRIASSLEARVLDAGYHRIPLSTGSVEGHRLASGVYFVRIATEHDGAETHQVMVVR